MTYKAFLKRHVFSQTPRKNGFGLLETVLAIGIGTIIMAITFDMMEERSKDLRDSMMSEQLKTLTTATEKFMRENYVSLRDNAPQTFETSVLNLGENYTNSPYGHSYKIVTRRTGQRLDIALVAGDPTTELDPYRVPNITGMAGPKVGYFPSAIGDAQTAADCGQDVCGSYGSWSTSVAGFSATGLAEPQFASVITASDMDVTAPYLYRDAIPGQPQLNRMNTNIDMAGNNINNTGTLSSQTIQNSGTITTNALDSATIQNSGTITSQGDITTNGTLYSQNISNSGTITSTGKISTDSDIEAKGDLISINIPNGTRRLNENGNAYVNDLYLGKYNAWIMDLMPKVKIDNIWGSVSNGSSVPYPTCTQEKPNAQISFMPRYSNHGKGTYCSHVIHGGDSSGDCYAYATDQSEQIIAYPGATGWTIGINTITSSSMYNTSSSPSSSSYDVITYCK